jgi:hypothetical protein
MNTTSFGLNSPASSRKVARAKESDISINTRHLIKGNRLTLKCSPRNIITANVTSASNNKNS